jgi:hypothetical protein
MHLLIVGHNTVSDIPLFVSEVVSHADGAAFILPAVQVELIEINYWPETVSDHHSPPFRYCFLLSHLVFRLTFSNARLVPTPT